MLHDVVQRKKFYTLVLQKCLTRSARAIINKPQLLILDEATSSLDTVNENYFYNMIKSLGVTILSISHRLNTVVDSDRIYLIDDGEFVAEGSHESLLKTSNLYAKIYNEKRK